MITKLLTKCYLTQQPWQEFFMPEKDAIDYFGKMIDRGNIISIVYENELLGYVESWKINFEQLGRLVCKAPFFTLEENTTDGEICFLANIWINSDYRRGLIFKSMEIEFFKNNSDCEYYCGFALRKGTRPTKVFKKSQLNSKLFTGALYGNFNDK
jgi:hypothetical protein